MSLNANLRAAFARWASETGGTVQLAAGKSGVPKATIDKWLSLAKPAKPQADSLARVCRVIGTTVEKLAFDGDISSTAPVIPYEDIIKLLNRLPEHRLRDVQRLIEPWANEVRGASQQNVDIIADLKILPTSRLDDVRRLISPWAEDAKAGAVAAVEDGEEYQKQSDREESAARSR